MATSRKNWVVDLALEEGFTLAGVVRATSFPDWELFAEWLGRGFHGEMKYLEDPRRREPQLLHQDLKSVVVCALNYNTDAPYSINSAAQQPKGGPRGWVSRYAWGSDYHEVLWQKLSVLEEQIRRRSGEPHWAKGFADTGPVAERIFAKYAGLGWIGKNTLLLNQEVGSWLFLGVILTSAELEPSLEAPELPSPDLCGNCRQCLDACPTGALVEPYVMDARRCISYLTIELRGAIPEDLRQSMGWQVYGCDICQDVCPFNHSAPVTTNLQFQPRSLPGGNSLYAPSLIWLAGLTPEGFSETFRGSAMKRTKWRGLVRNACIALGNSGLTPADLEWSRALGVLEEASHSSEESISESAQWALRRIQQQGTASSVSRSAGPVEPS